MPRTPHADLLANLVATVSLLEDAAARKIAPNMAVASNTMFETMMNDYRGAVERGRAYRKAGRDRPSWLLFAAATPSDRKLFDELSRALAGDEAFLAEAEDLGLEYHRFHYLRGRVDKARQAFVDAGGSFGEFRDGHFHEPEHPRRKTYSAGDTFTLGGAEMTHTRDGHENILSFMEDVIDRQTLLRLHVLTMLEGREQAREAKAAKEAVKAAEKAAKAAARAEAEAAREAQALADAKLSQ